MFHFGTDHTNQERRDGFVSFRCFLWLGGRGGERTGTGIGEEGRGLGEDGRGRTRESGRMGEDFERMEEDGRGVGEDGHGTLRRKKTGLGTGQKKDSEQDKKRTRRRKKTGL